MIELLAVLKQLWLLWFMLLFTGIVVWSFWPARKGSLQAHALIPLRDEAADAFGAGFERKR